MAITPEEIDAEIARREALAAGQTQTVAGGRPVPTTTTVYPPRDPNREITGLPPGGELPPSQPGDTQVPIPPAAMDPVEVEIQRREAAVRPATGDSAIKRFDQAVLSVVPPGLRSTLTAMGRVGANFNDTLAKHLGATPDMIDEQLQKVGVRLFNQPNASANAIRGWMREAGIPVERTKDLEGQLGRGLFEGMIQSAAWYAALPRILALGGIQAGSAVGEVARRIGEFSRANPALFTAQNVAAAQGATIAEEEVGGPLAALVGGVAGTAVPGAVGLAARATTYPVRAATRLLGSPDEALSPILAPGTRTGPAREFAAAERDSQQFRLAQEHEQLIQGSGPADVGAASTNLSRTLDTAEEAARTHMRSLYAPYADMPVDPAITVNRMARLQQAVTPSERAGPNFPGDWTDRIDQLYVRRIPAEQPPAAVPFGQPLPTLAPAHIEITPTTLDDLINLRSDLLREAANARRGAAGTPSNPKRARYLTRLAQGVQENIDAATRGTPAEAGIQEANRFARTYYDMFERGIVGRTFTPLTGRRETAVPEEGLAQKMLETGRTRGQDAFAQLQQMDTPPPVGFGNYNTLEAAERAVRALFRNAAEASPQGAERWYAANRRTIGTFAQTAHELEQIATRLTRIHEIERGLQTDTLARFIGPDPDRAYARIFSAADPAAEVRVLMQTMGLDRDALRAFRAGIVDQFMRANNGSPLNAAKLLADDPAIGRMMREVFRDDPAALSRLYRITHTAARLEAGTTRIGGRTARMGASAALGLGLGAIDPILAVGAVTVPIIGRIVGAQTGTMISHGMGRGNIQTPAIVSGIMRNWAADTFGGIAPSELFARAVLDARWERVLLSKAPTTTAEARAFARTVRRLIATSSAISNQISPTPGENQ